MLPGPLTRQQLGEPWSSVETALRDPRRAAPRDEVSHLGPLAADPAPGAGAAQWGVPHLQPGWVLLAGRPPPGHPRISAMGARASSRGRCRRGGDVAAARPGLGLGFGLGLDDERRG